MTILNVAYPLASVGPDAIGGAEQIVSRLDEALVRAGHRSLVIACEGSRCAGELIPTPRPPGPLMTHLHPEAEERHRETIGRTLQQEPVDLVHLHGLDFHRYLPEPGVPTLVTLHLPPSWYEDGALRPPRRATYLQCVSVAQQRHCPPGLPLLPPIENGVPVDRLTTSAAKTNEVAWIGRICPEKGLHLAIAAAAAADVPLTIAGDVFPFTAHLDYFAAQIRPRLSPRCRFQGPVGPTAKRDLLGRARALLVTSTVPETSSLVAMEALAAGTPVIAFPVGALPEIVEHHRTGFLVEDVRAMAAAIRAAPTLDPEACRETARRRFSAERMTAKYLERYAQIVRGAASWSAKVADAAA